MGKATSIGWTHHTFNPWWGCHKVDPLCDNCYAEGLAKRYGHDVWGKDAPRRFFGDGHWKDPLKWNAAALAAGERRRVFCASQADVFEDRRDLIPHRQRLWKLIEATPALDWLLLTKRPENFELLMPMRLWRNYYTTDPKAPDRPWPNVWLGVSAGTVKGWNLRWPILARTPAAVRFVSAEPLLEDIGDAMLPIVDEGVIPDWIIFGGESGGRRRPMEIGWMERAVELATMAGSKVYVKQDTAFRAGQQGRISLPLWERKEFPCR